MTEQSATTDPKPPTAPPCAKCGSTVHTTGYHDGGAPPRDGEMSPMGYHDGGLAAENFGKDSGTDGHHDGGTPSK